MSHFYGESIIMNDYNQTESALNDHCDVSQVDYAELFSEDQMEKLLPGDRADQFFDALYGDAAEGAYNIRLHFNGCQTDHLNFEFHLQQRPGKCLACNLTYGLPEVFSRHPVINLKEIVSMINTMLPEDARCNKWKLGNTQEISSSLHVIPFVLYMVK